MKLLSKIGMALLAMVVFMGCLPGASDPRPDPGLEVDMTNHPLITAAFQVRNDTQHELIAFRSSVSPSNLIGGIPAGAQNHGLRNESSLPGLQPEAFPVVLITREQLNQHQPNWAYLNNNPFTRIFVFFNPAADPGAPAEVYTISDRIGGNATLTIQNPTNFNWEIRVGGHRGPTIAYISEGMQAITISVASGEYYFFPVIRTFNPVLSRLSTIYPRNAGHQPWFTGVPIPPGGSPTLNVNAALQQLNLNGLTLGVAWLTVVNNHAENSGVRLYRGADPVTDSIGFSLIPAAGNRTIHLEMPSPMGANTFNEYIELATLAVGVGGIRAPLETLTGETMIRFDRDYLYTIQVTGTHNVLSTDPNFLRAVITGTPRRIDINEFN